MLDVGYREITFHKRHLQLQSSKCIGDDTISPHSPNTKVRQEENEPSTALGKKATDEQTNSQTKNRWMALSRKATALASGGLIIATALSTSNFARWSSAQLQGAATSRI